MTSASQDLYQYESMVETVPDGVYTRDFGWDLLLREGEGVTVGRPDEDQCPERPRGHEPEIQRSDSQHEGPPTDEVDDRWVQRDDEQDEETCCYVPVPRAGDGHRVRLVDQPPETRPKRIR